MVQVAAAPIVPYKYATGQAAVEVRDDTHAWIAGEVFAASFGGVGVA